MQATGEPHNRVEVTILGRLYDVTPCFTHQRYVTAGFIVPACRMCKMERK